MARLSVVPVVLALRRGAVATPVVVLGGGCSNGASGAGAGGAHKRRWQWACVVWA